MLGLRGSDLVGLGQVSLNQSCETGHNFTQGDGFCIPGAINLLTKVYLAHTIKIGHKYLCSTRRDSENRMYLL